MISGYHKRPRTSVPTEVPRALRKRMTPQEAKLWVALRRLRPAGYTFRRQVPIGPYVVDFACLKARLVVEVDGAQHGLDGHAARDAVRDARLAERGFRVARFWNHQVDRELDVVMDTIFARLTEPCAPLLPCRGRWIAAERRDGWGTPEACSAQPKSAGAGRGRRGGFRCAERA